MGEESKKKMFPYKSVLDLSNLLRYWEARENGNDKSTGKRLYGREIRDIDFFRQPIDDFELLAEHKADLQRLLSVVIPPALAGSTVIAVMVPLSLQGVYATIAYQALIPFEKMGDPLLGNFREDNINELMTERAGTFILNKFYGTSIALDRPILISILDQDTDLERIYKVELNLKFVDVKCEGPLPDLTEKQIKELLNNTRDPHLWTKYLSPDLFVFSGFSLCQLVDVTEGEMMSEIKYELLEKKSVLQKRTFESIQDKIRAIFRMPDLRLGLSFFDKDKNIISNKGMSAWQSFMLPSEGQVSSIYFKNSIYEEAYSERRMVIVENLNHLKKPSKLERHLIKSGITNIALAPLVTEGQVVGMLEIGTPHEGRLTSMSTGKLDAVLPMFASAVGRALDEIENEVRALIQEQCTSIHPSVEWRFLNEGYKILENKGIGRRNAFSEVMFDQVFPLYGVSDVRNSSVERSNAIRHDLQENLKAAADVMKSIKEFNNMPILDEMVHRIETELQRMSFELHSGDESSVVSFLKEDVEPAFKHLHEKVPESRAAIKDYWSLLDPGIGLVYKRRRDFEESLYAINQLISDYLDEADETAQEIFPHYFEKYVTDGVEYDIYLGGSLVHDRDFNPIYVNNFRLWQLMVMCEIAVKVMDIRETLPLKLEIAQLILVHGQPMAIRFKKDEKRFDVDGAYNIRYEIIKKRIDKARIAETGERLTQPGKIAIVYSSQREASEYFHYIDYLQSIGYVTEEVEELELEDLQGAQGLRAIRLEINRETDSDYFGSLVLKDILELLNPN